MNLYKSLKSKITNLLSPRVYWLIVGKINPYSAALEGVKSKEKFYTLGLYELNLFKKLKVIKKGNRTLEIGCGPGRIQKALVDFDNNAKVFGTDISASMIEIAQKNVPSAHFTVNNGVDLSGYQNSFLDLVYSFVVFQHIDENIFDNYLKETFRVLKKGGYLVFQIQSSESLKDYFRPIKHPWHLRRYSRKEIHQKLEYCGFKSIKIFNMAARVNPKQVDESGFLFKAQKS